MLLKQSSLSNSTLHDLLMINCDSVSLQSFNADPGIDLRWNEKKTRCINQDNENNTKVVKPTVLLIMNPALHRHLPQLRMK